MHDGVGAFRGLGVKFICDWIPSDVIRNFASWNFDVGVDRLLDSSLGWRVDGWFVYFLRINRRSVRRRLFNRRDCLSNFPFALASQQARDGVAIFGQQMRDGRADHS